MVRFAWCVDIMTPFFMIEDDKLTIELKSDDDSDQFTFRVE